MAHLTIESAAAPTVPGSTEQTLADLVTVGATCCAILAAANPGILAGALLAASWRWLDRPPEWLRVLSATLLLVPLLWLETFVVVGWPWRLWVSPDWPPALAPVNGYLAMRSFCTEMLAGPMWLEVVLLLVTLWSRGPRAQVVRERRREQQRWRAISGERNDPSVLRLEHPRPLPSSSSHPPGCVRLGIDAETDQALDLQLPVELATHLFLIGASGSGKTTTLARVADGVVSNRFAVVIVDCKGGGLGEVARDLARRHGVPFYLVDPDAPDSLGYNPCYGDAAAIANKLIGAFTYAPAAEIYKNIAMEAIPVIVRALTAAGDPVTLEALYGALAPRGMTELAHRVKYDAHLAQRLLELAERRDDRIGRAGYAGLRYRLGALLEGRFGGLFRSDQALEWERALARPSVTYIALSTLASSEDVELMGRVIAQDLKQVCARRIRALGKGERLVPVLVAFDEFAALREAEQLVDLSLQARQALMPLAISTQYLPESVPLRKACLASGLLIAHRVEGEDAEAIANELGTRPAAGVTNQIDWITGYSEKGSIRREERRNVSPNELRTFTVGQAVVRSVPTRRYGIAWISGIPSTDA